MPIQAAAYSPASAGFLKTLLGHVWRVWNTRDVVEAEAKSGPDLFRASWRVF
jgi:hypothetical protein